MKHVLLLILKFLKNMGCVNAWLLELRDKDGNDLYPEIRKRATQ